MQLENQMQSVYNNILSFDNVVLFGYSGSNPTPFDTPGEIQDNKIYGDVMNYCVMILR